MYRRRLFPPLCGMVLTIAGASHAGPPESGSGESPHLGRPATPSEIAEMDLSIESDGKGLPHGSGTVAQGSATYTAKCEACHGIAGGGAIADRLTGGVGSFASKKPLRTAASYWPYAPPLFDYIRRAMPFNAPQSLSDDEVYGVVAYLLSIDHIVPADTRLDAKALSKIVMPNRQGFVSLRDKNFDGNIDGDRSRDTPPPNGLIEKPR
jgi:hypothetical protein